MSDDALLPLSGKVGLFKERRDSGGDSGSRVLTSFLFYHCHTTQSIHMFKNKTKQNKLFCFFLIIPERISEEGV